MADKRELILAVKGKDDGASRVLKDVGDAADKSEDNLDGMRRGLDKLDKKIGDTKTTIADLRKEILKTGDVELFKDVNKQTARLRNLGKQREFLTAGSDAADGFSMSFSQRIGPLLARAPISPGLLTAAASAVPVVAPVLAAAITGGVALGVVGIGAAIAAKNPEVKAAASDLSSLIGRELQDAAAPFVPATLRSIATVRDGFQDLRPVLDDIFDISAPFLQTLTEGAVGGAKALVPALRDVLRNAEPVVEVIGDHLTRAAEAAGTSLRLMTQDSDTSAEALDGLLTAGEGAIVGLGAIVGGINKADSAMEPFKDTLRKLGPLGILISGPLDYLGDTFGKDADKADEAAEAASGLAGKMLDLNTMSQIAAAGTALYTEWLNKQNQAYQNSIDDAIDAERATLRFAEATDTAKGAVDRKKGASVAERGALLSMIEAANTATTANEKQGVSSAEAARKHKTQRDALIAVATKMFGSRDAAIAYVDKLLKIPASRRTEITAQNAQALGAIAAVNTGLARINGKTVTTYIKVRTIGGIDRVTSSTGGGREVDDPSRRRRASGGPVRRGITYLVGEEGPELLTAPANGYITKASTTRRMLSGQGQTAPSRVDLSDASLERLARMIARAMSSVTVTATVQDSGRLATVLGRAG